MEVVNEEVSKKRAAPEAAEDIAESAPQTKKAKTAVDLFREQLEYYFSVANYPTDKWMNLTAAENGGCAYRTGPKYKDHLLGQHMCPKLR
jgi:hypothetical protein